MRIGIPYGHQTVELEIAEQNLVRIHRQEEPAALADPVEAMRQALEQPFQFPALRRALTPDDHVAIVVDEEVPHLAELLTPLLHHLHTAQISPDAMTILCQPSPSNQPWLDDVPEEFEDMRVEIHDPGNRKHLAYLATTQNGRRIYLNRTAVDADQLVVLTRRGYDAVHGYSGAETAIYPALSDEETQKVCLRAMSLGRPGAASRSLREETHEVAWLLGAPFFIQIIEGSGDNVAHIVAGVLESSSEGERLLDASWHVEVSERADTVVACLSGNPEYLGFADFAHALANAARVVKPEGRIVLLTDSEPALGQAAQVLRETGDSRMALRRFVQDGNDQREAGFCWASAAEQATIYLLSKLPMETAEELLTVPLTKVSEVQKLVGDDRSLIVLPDAHKMMAQVSSGAD